MRVLCMRSCRPFCCGRPGSINSGITPSRIHQADSLDNRVEFGVWGGMTERERRALLRRRPNVTSWRRLLEAAMTDFETSAVGAPKHITVAS